MSSDEARELAAGDPYSFLHVIRPEIDLDPTIDPYDDRVYEKGRENLKAMIERGWLARDRRPAYYVYRLVMGEHVQTGVLGAAAVADYLDDRIKKHEHTRPQKERDRFRLNSALDAHPGPVLLAHSPAPELGATVEEIAGAEPAVRFRAPDGIEHSLWVVDRPELCERIERGFAGIENSYVADGHHRAATAAKLGAQRLAAIDSPTGEEPAGYFLAAHFPSDQLRVLDYNRVVKDLAGLSEAGVIERIGEAIAASRCAPSLAAVAAR